MIPPECSQHFSQGNKKVRKEKSFVSVAEAFWLALESSHPPAPEELYSSKQRLLMDPRLWGWGFSHTTTALNLKHALCGNTIHCLYTCTKTFVEDNDIKSSPLWMVLYSTKFKGMKAQAEWPVLDERSLLQKGPSSGEWKTGEYDDT